MTNAFWQALAAWAFVMEEHDRAAFNLANDGYTPDDISRERVEIYRLHFSLKRKYETKMQFVWQREYPEEYYEELEADSIRERLNKEN